MCGRFTIVPTIDFSERFGLPAGTAMPPRYNVAPGQEVPVLVRDGANRLVPMTWGFLPPAGKDPAGGRPMINARAETLLSRPSFRDAAMSRRCLVPASGFYEWRREGRRKVPFYIRLKEAPVFAFAGIYDPGTGPSGCGCATFAVITTTPNELVAPLHDRMPAILPRDREADWARPGPVAPSDLGALLVPFPAPEMEAYPVSSAVNDPQNDGPGLIRPLKGLGI